MGNSKQGVKCSGGPAFPTTEEHGFNNGEPGMTLRDYFAVRAPAEIPDWFQYAMPQPRPSTPFKHAELTDEQEKQLEGLGDWLDETQVDLEVVAFSRKCEKIREEQKAWDLAHHSGQYFAWRWHYADMMIAVRGAA